jgi:hypothetical protein
MSEEEKKNTEHEIIEVKPSQKKKDKDYENLFQSLAILFMTF